MICPYCGYYCEDGVRFCPSCGNQIVSAEPEFVPLSTASEPQQPNLSSAELLQHQADERTVRRYKGWLVFSLFFALILVAGAVYLMAFMPEPEAEPEPEDPPAEAEVILAPNVGSWANDDGFIIMTASGKFAADDLSGTYTMDDTLIVFDCGDDVIVAEYTLEDDILILTTSGLGNESSHAFYFVSERTDLSYSELTEMWQVMTQ